VGSENWEGPGGIDPRWRNRRGPGAFSPERGGTSKILRIVVVVLACVLVGTLGWQGYQRYFRPAEMPQSGRIAPIGRPYSADTANDPAARGWEPDFANAINDATTAGKAGDVTSAEMETDRAASIVGSAWQKGFVAQPEFFTGALAALDGVSATHPESERLGDHVFQAKIALAQLRWIQGNAKDLSAGAVDESSTPTGRLVLSAPRAVTAHQVVNAAAIGSSYVDATKIPDSAEVFLPPATRGMEDGVRVNGLTIEGASQTLDGVAWKDVTFVGTRLRYEGGATSLKNVKFVRCTFGFADDEGGRKLVEALARGNGTVDVAKSARTGDGRVVTTE
jgi:hypothetical protein